jgi:hypothetical protein
VLLINSESDPFAADTRHMLEVANEPKALQMYSGSRHGVQIFDSRHGEDLKQRLLAFVEAHLK